MKSLQRIFAVIAFIMAANYVAQAQYCGHSGTGSGPSICTAGTNLTAPGFSPVDDSVPCVIQGVPYSQTIQVKVPTTVTSGGSTYPLNYIKIDSIGNLPCGLCWATNKASNQFNGNEQFCIHIIGTSYDNVGEFKLKIIVDANVTAFGIPITQANQDASAAGLIFYARVQAPNGTCDSINHSLAGNTSLATGPAPSNAVTAGGPLTFCAGGSVVLTATQTGASYQWYNGSTAINGATGQTYTATTAGSYTCNIVKNCVGVLSTAKVVVVNAAPTASVTPVGPVILCTGSTQVLTVTPTGGSSVQWYNGAGAITNQIGTNYTATATGTYYAIATLNGCTGTSNSVSVQISGTPPTPTVSATTLSLCPGHTDTLDAGAGYTTYAWSNSLGSAQTAHPTAAGTYTVTVTNGVCSGTGSVTITAGTNATTPTITPSGTVTICQGTTATLTSSAASTYSWSNGATTRAITVSGGGPYTVTISNTTQCGTASSSPVTISVTPKPTASVTPVGPVVICGSGTQVLTATGGGTYQWLKNNAPIAGQTAATYTASQAGNYSCIVTANSCFDTSNVVNVQIGSALSPTITSTHPYLCTGAIDTLDVGTGYTTYAWSGGGATRYKNINTAGTYTVTVTTGACSGTASINIAAQGPTPTPTITAGGPTTFCTGGSVVLTSSSANGNVWSNSATTHSITATTSGSYTVTNNNGCGAATSTATVVTVNTIPNAQITPSGSTIICGGSSQTLTATPAGASYLWLDNGAAISGQTAATYSATTSGAYRALVTVNGCSDTSNTATITVSGTPPTPTITATAQTLCPGATDTLDAGAGYTSYAWSGSLGTAHSATVTTGGTYTVTVHNGVCAGSASITINQGTGAVTPTISVTGSLHLCGSDSVVLTSSSPTGNLWSNTATTQSITAYNNGVFSVTVSGTCGSATSLADTVVHNTYPQVYLGVDTGTCAGDSLTLNAGTDGTSYLWSTGAATSMTNVYNTAEYYVSVTKNGCTAVDSIHTTFDAVPAANFTASLGVLTATPAGAIAYQWKKNGGDIPGATSQTFNANTSGTANYSVVVTVGFCSATSASQLVTITGITDLSQSLSLNIYPNPTNSKINIDYTLARNETLAVDMTDMTGRVVATLYTGSQPDGTHALEADLTGLAGGVYFVNFRTAEGTVVRKIVKE